MGVDICLHIEVHRKGMWHAFLWQTPKALECEPTEDGEWATHHACSTFKFHHIDYFLRDKGICGLPDDVADETVVDMREDSGKGWFYFSDFMEYLNEKREGLFETLSKCKEMEVVNRLDRIERLTRGEDVPILEDSGLAGFEIKEIIEDYEDSVDVLNQLYWTVNILTGGMVGKDTRIVYEVW